jgi:GntR family transcriptional regulator
MMININYRDPRAIYEQIMDGIRRLVISGAVQPDEKLPSVRELAGELAINPNTIQRAYRELEGEGYIYSVSGKGSFVARHDEVDEGRKRELLAEFDSAAVELEFLGVSREELCKRLKEGINGA